MTRSDELNANVALACLIPLCLFMLSFYWLGKPTLSLRTVWEIIQGRSAATRTGHPQHGYFSLERAATSYNQYLILSTSEIMAMRTSYAKLGRAHKRVGYELGYPAKLARLEEVTAVNEKVTRAIAACAQESFPHLQRSSTVGDGDLARVREALKHFVRDWSTEGAKEREVIFSPILNALRQESTKDKADMKVLVPGSGLGRLAWEISQLGYDTMANELSFFMNLAFRFLASPRFTSKTDEHVVHPYSYWFSHQRTNEALFRGISFPDALPRLGDKLHLVETDFLEQRAPGEGYDYIVTLFFIDTSLDVISTIQHIYDLLRPGGRWINLGPLLWSGGAQARLELNLAEVFRLSKAIGFHIESEHGECPMEVYCRKTISCEYTADQEAMMKWIYQAEFWVATKHT